MADVVTFTNPACPHCQRLKAYLSGRGVSYTDRDVTQDDEARTELARMDAPGVPVIRVGDETVIGFDQGRLDQLLGGGAGRG